MSGRSTVPSGHQKGHGDHPLPRGASQGDGRPPQEGDQDHGRHLPLRDQGPESRGPAQGRGPPGGDRGRGRTSRGGGSEGICRPNSVVYNHNDFKVQRKLGVLAQTTLSAGDFTRRPDVLRAPGRRHPHHQHHLPGHPGHGSRTPCGWPRTRT